jgi:hypothetical protein
VTRRTSHLIMKCLLRAAALVAIGTGTSVMVGGTRVIPTGGAVSPTVDSVLRFYAAWWAGAGLLMWHVAPDTARHDGVVRGLIGINFLGGLVRLHAARQTGKPHFLFQIIAIEELLLAPVAIALQRRIVR